MLPTFCLGIPHLVLVSCCSTSYSKSHYQPEILKLIKIFKLPNYIVTINQTLTFHNIWKYFSASKVVIFSIIFLGWADCKLVKWIPGDLGPVIASFWAQYSPTIKSFLTYKLDGVAPLIANPPHATPPLGKINTFYDVTQYAIIDFVFLFFTKGIFSPSIYFNNYLSDTL